jgi:very-short-patch-repair endonuclease
VQLFSLQENPLSLRSLYNKALQPLARNLRNNGTKAEACLWKYVLKTGLMNGFNFKRQRPVLNYIADFLCAELMLIIVVDGLSHDLKDAQKRDAERDARLKNAGYTVLRFSNNDVLRNIAGVRRAIEEWIEKNSEAKHHK